MNSSQQGAQKPLVLLCLIAVTLAAWFSPLDHRAQDYVEAGLKRAFVTFAAARGLNAIISVIQGTELSIGVAAEATFSIGEVLDPVNDMVEQFSDLMLLATVSFGIQEVLLIIGQHAFVKVGLTLVAALWTGLYLSGTRIPRLLNALLVVGLMARFAIPVAAIGAETAFDVFLKDQYEESAQKIAVAKGAISDAVPGSSWWNSGSAEEKLDPTPKPETSSSDSIDERIDQPEKGWLDRLRDSISQSFASTDGSLIEPVEGEQGGDQDNESWFSSMKSGFLSPFSPSEKLKQLQVKLGSLRVMAEETAENLVRLIVVFLLETLIIPLLMLWLMYLAARSFVSPTAMTEIGAWLERRVSHSWHAEARQTPGE